ncbi:MAG: DUF4038 domain-containing protein [Planctomycetota bacterium]
MPHHPSWLLAGAVVAVAVGSCCPLHAGEPTVPVWQPFEATFSSSQIDANPFTDVEADVIFISGSETWKMPAFWAGGDDWTVRFAPPKPGTYRYRVVAGGSANGGFAVGERSFTATATAEPNRLFLQGFPLVAADGRHFAHADGTPFFWLGDTWWKCLSRRLSFEDFQELATNRARTGFTVVQIVIGPYPDEAMLQPGWETDGGMPYRDRAFREVNLPAFASIDRRIRCLVDAGLVPAIVGGWGRPQAGGKSTLDQVGLEGFTRHWRHLIARYGALPVIWIVGGEVKDAYGPWSEVAAFVRLTDPYGHPLCHHAPGDPRTTLRDQEAFDFDMVAIGHDGQRTIGTTLELVKASRAREPTRPVVCGEACYERHMQTNFEDVQRQLFWSLLLSGAAGHTYGAAGIWQAGVEGDPGIEPVYDWATWREGMAYPGAIQLGLGRRLLEEHEWWRFEPRPDWCEGDCFAAGIPGEVRILYRPKRKIYDWQGPVVKQIEPDVRYEASYFDPVRGRRFNVGPVVAPTGEFRAPRLPAPQDWVLVLRRR